MSGAFFNAPNMAGNLDLAVSNSNGITTKNGALSLTAKDNGDISIGNTSSGEVQLTVNNSGVIIKDNLQVLGAQNTFNADDVTTSTLRMNNETLGDTEDVSVSKSVSLINRTVSGNNTVSIPTQSHLHNELSQDGLIKNIFYDESSVTSGADSTSTTVDFTWPKYYPIGPVTHKVAATIVPAFENRNALNGLSVVVNDSANKIVTIGTKTINCFSLSGSTWLNRITDSTNPGDWTITTSATSGGTYVLNNSSNWNKELYVKIQYNGQGGSANSLVFINSTSNPTQNTTAFQNALSVAASGDIIELANGTYNTLNINKPVKIVSAKGTKALLQGGITINSPSAAPITELELVNLRLQGTAGDSSTVTQSGSTGFVKNVKVVGCEFNGQEIANSRFWYGKYNVGYWKFHSCTITGYRSWYLMDNTSSSYFPPIPFAGCTEYLSNIELKNCEFSNNTGTPCFRGGGGSTDGHGGQDPTVMPHPIDTAVVDSCTFDYSNIDYDNTPAIQKGWCSVEVNKVKNLTINNNLFKNRVNAQSSNKHSHSYHVQCWGVPNEAEGSWQLNVTNNKFVLDSNHPYINGHPSGGVIIANSSGTNVKGWGLSDTPSSKEHFPLPNPSTNISNNSFENMDFGVSALSWYKPNPITIRTSAANGGPARYLATSSVTLGDVVTAGSEIKWSAASTPFQLNLERDSKLGADNTANPVSGTVEYWNGDRGSNTSFINNNGGDADGHMTAGNWADGNLYTLKYDANATAMDVSTYTSGSPTVVSESGVQWTITGWNQTVLRGHIDTTTIPGKTRFVVKLSDEGLPEYRPFNSALDVNPQERFTQAHTELIAYVFDGAVTAITAGSVFSVELLTSGSTGLPNKLLSIEYTDGSKTPDDLPSVMYARSGKINCHDNHWGGACQPSRLGANGWYDLGAGRTYEHIYSATGEGATVTPNVVLTDNVTGAPAVATNPGQSQVVTSEDNYYPAYQYVAPAQETVTFKVRVFDRQSSAGKAFFIYNDACAQWEESPVLRMKPGNMYLFKFDSATELATYPLKMSTTSDGSNNGGSAYEETTISPGTVDGQYVTVYPHVHDDLADNLYYFCVGNAGMGNEIATQRTSKTDSGNNVVDVAWTTDAATSATAVESAITASPAGSIIRLGAGDYGAIDITKSCKLVSATGVTANLTGGVTITPPDNTVIDGVELWNLSVSGGAAGTSPSGTTDICVKKDGTVQGAVNNLKLMNCEFDGKSTTAHFANFTYVTGELTIDNCSIHHYDQHYYLCGTNQTWIPLASPVNNAEGYLSDLVFTNNHIYNCVGSPSFRGGAGTNNNGSDPATCFVERPINTATVSGNMFDFTSTASNEGMKGWNCIEVNKCVSVQVNNNHFLNHRRGDAGAGYIQNFAHGFAVQVWAYDNWGLQVYDNHFQNESGFTEKSGGVYCHLAAWSQTANGLPGASVKMACPSSMITNNHFNGTEHALYFGQGFQEFIASDFSDDARATQGPSPPQLFAPNNYFGAGGASKRQRLVGGSGGHNDYNQSNQSYSNSSLSNWTSMAGLSVLEHFVTTSGSGNENIGTITLVVAAGKLYRFSVLSATASNSIKSKTVTTGLTHNSGANLVATSAVSQAALDTDSVAIDTSKSNALTSAMYIRLTDGTNTVDFLNNGVSNGTVTPNVNMNVYEEDALANTGVDAVAIDTHAKDKLLVVGGGLASALVFDSTGQSANLLYVGGKWRVIQAGAGVVV